MVKKYSIVFQKKKGLMHILIFLMFINMMLETLRWFNSSCIGFAFKGTDGFNRNPNSFWF